MDRVGQAVKPFGGSLVVEFDREKLPHFIWFRVKDKRGGLPIPYSGDHTPNAVASWSDERLSQVILALGGGRI
jgi:hypothetical protein